MGKVTEILYHDKVVVFVMIYSMASLIFIGSLYQSLNSIKEINGKVYFLDVGQGDSILIISNSGNRVLIDAGNTDGKSVDEIRKILPWFDRRIDLAIGTHADIDHIGGFTKIVQNFSVGRFLFSHLHTTKAVENFLFNSVDRAGVATSTIDRGARINFENNIYYKNNNLKVDEKNISDKIDILYPPRQMKMTSDKDTNLFSIVARAHIGTTTFLLTGDAPKSVELKLVLAGDDLNSDILKVGHHGSRTSTDPIFLEKVSPTYAIISAGLNNRYGHPHKETIETLEKENVKILRTDEIGTIVF